jgi:hypothetical protein
MSELARDLLRETGVCVEKASIETENKRAVGIADRRIIINALLYNSFLCS